VIAEVDPEAFPSDDVNICVGDFISPSEVATLHETCAPKHSGGRIVFGSRPRFCSLESVMPGAAASEQKHSLKAGAVPIAVAAACCCAAASLLWMKFCKK
jgi:hypothetical protein